MKLPLFHTQIIFKKLFEEMDTKYKKNEISVWDFQGASILERIIKEGEVVIEEANISNFIDDDSFFRVEGKLVLVYIRDQYLNRNPYKDNHRSIINDGYDKDITEEYVKEHQSYRYHLIQCQTIRRHIRDQRVKRYVLRSPTYKGEKGDDTFKINIIEKSSKDILLTMNDTLKVCKNCLSEGNINSYKKLDIPTKEKIWDTFNYKDFFENMQIQHLANLNFDDYRISRVNLYPKNFDKISRSYRVSKNWICEECKIDLSNEIYQSFLHTHHINASKADNSIFNFKALCIECHSNKPKHTFMKSSPMYSAFIRMKNSKQFSLGRKAKNVIYK